MGYVRQEEGFDALVALNESLDVVSFAPGVKWNVGGRVLLSANVLASLTNKLVIYARFHRKVLLREPSATRCHACLRCGSIGSS
jgi:hypothetical protein